MEKKNNRLNPCSNGILSDTMLGALLHSKHVLILVLMEYSLTSHFPIIRIILLS